MKDESKAGGWCSLMSLRRGWVRPVIAEGYHHARRLLTNPAYRQYHRMTGKTLRTRNGVTRLFGKYEVNYTDGASLVSAFYEIFVNESYHIGAVDHPLFIDGGANVGLASLYWVLHYPECRVLAFEPDGANFSCLRKNVESWGNERVEVRRQAIAGHSGKCEFVSKATDCSGIAMAGVARDPEGLIETVDAVSLREIIRDAPGDIDLLKLDIEGGEYAALSGATDALAKVQRVFVECHTWPEIEQQNIAVIALLRDCGFRCYVHTGGAPRAPFRGVTTNAGGYDQFLNVFAVR